MRIWPLLLEGAEQVGPYHQELVLSCCPRDVRCNNELRHLPLFTTAIFRCKCNGYQFCNSNWAAMNNVVKLLHRLN